MLIAACVCLLLAIAWGGHDYPWSSGIIIGCFVAAFALGGLFIYIEAKVAVEPIIPLRKYSHIAHFIDFGN